MFRLLVDEVNDVALIDIEGNKATWIYYQGDNEIDDISDPDYWFSVDYHKEDLMGYLLYESKSKQEAVDHIKMLLVLRVVPTFEECKQEDYVYLG
ncbi:hypothetical protein PYDG_00012 [Pseudoalteromonas phage pYD6-A]|uniref:Uncharacterized protein n=1 Tax=Pseudoalteromonas phage pYD6-A TaxID=754052 RepID=M4T3U9_9CAUD|nr:hypothetical protein PYDG_00012 [Pseudoalteromonas phage pYD6-A]AGH57544.1 hypothetical protein PYDG_00012 [Pseudoalteromonas phage pYD6-A]